MMKKRVKKKLKKRRTKRLDRGLMATHKEDLILKMKRTRVIEIRKQMRSFPVLKDKMKMMK